MTGGVDVPGARVKYVAATSGGLSGPAATAGTVTVAATAVLKTPWLSYALKPIVSDAPDGPATNAHWPIWPIGISSNTAPSVWWAPLSVR